VGEAAWLCATVAVAQQAACQRAHTCAEAGIPHPAAQQTAAEAPCQCTGTSADEAGQQPVGDGPASGSVSGAAREVKRRGGQRF
jgi:hypothetical protein